MTDQKRKIVLIEDEIIVSNLLVQKLERAGYAVSSSLDGEAGLNLILEEKPDLVLLDMVLPKMNGFQILEKLSEEKLLPDLPVIIISNSGQPVEIERALKMGVRDYLIKLNFNPDEVLVKVGKVLKSAEENPTDGKDENPAPSDNKPGCNVLIVEDDVFMANLMERKFKQNNYKILKASNAAQAKEVLSSNSIDLILLDVVLPGMDGFTFLRELKKDEKLKQIPVVITSNLGQKEEIEKGFSEGATDYVIKAHVSPAEIVEKVMKIIGKCALK